MLNSFRYKQKNEGNEGVYRSGEGGGGHGMWEAPLSALSHRSYQIKYQIHFTLCMLLSCYFVFYVFFRQIARGHRPTLTPTLTPTLSLTPTPTPTLPQVRAPTRAGLRRAFWKIGKKCADHIKSSKYIWYFIWYVTASELLLGGRARVVRG